MLLTIRRFGNERKKKDHWPLLFLLKGTEFIWRQCAVGVFLTLQISFECKLHAFIGATFCLEKVSQLPGGCAIARKSKLSVSCIAIIDRETRAVACEAIIIRISTKHDGNLLIVLIEPGLH